MSAVLKPTRQLIPLAEWAKLAFPLKTPHMNTLHRWVQLGRIHPQPEKVGKTWHVEPHAQYQGD